MIRVITKEDKYVKMLDRNITEEKEICNIKQIKSLELPKYNLDHKKQVLRGMNRWRYK